MGGFSVDMWEMGGGSSGAREGFRVGSVCDVVPCVYVDRVSLTPRADRAGR